jgi:hypothetical protein
MSNALTDSTDIQGRVWQALRLGWTLAAVYGRLTQPNMRWANIFPKPEEKPLPRLFLSTRQPTEGELIWTDIQSLAYLLHQLYPPPKNDESAPYQLAEVTQFPASVDELFALAARTLATPEGKFSVPKTFYHDLNHWSRQIWARLNAENPLLAEAATFGAGLADTYWQWRLPTKTYRPPEAQSWQQLLHRERMNVMIKRVRQIETHLPAYVGPTLRHSLWEWDRAAEALARSAAPLSLKAEKKLRGNLRQQLRIWEDLAFNRPITYLLRAGDWRWVRFWSIILYALIVAVVITVPALLIYILTLTANFFMDQLFSWLGGITEFDDQLKLASAMIAVLAFFLTQFQRAAAWLRQLYPSIYNWLWLAKLTQRTLHSWDGKVKPWYKICWRRLWRGNN